MSSPDLSLAQLLLRILHQEMARSEQQPDPTLTYVFLREVQQASAPDVSAQAAVAAEQA